jgi:hypothetical protein
VLVLGPRSSGLGIGESCDSRVPDKGDEFLPWALLGRSSDDGGLLLPIGDGEGHLRELGRLSSDGHDDSGV